MDSQEIMKLKAEIFDLQVAFGKVKSDLDKKLKELNDKIKNDKD